MDPVKVIKTAGGKTLNIYRDTGSKNPRLHEDARARMLFLHNRHQLGDSHSFGSPQEIDHYVDSLDNAVVMPVYMIIWPKTGELLLDVEPFRNEPGAQAGQIGVIYISGIILEEIGDPEMLETREAAEQIMLEELELYNEWLNEEVYGYELLDVDGSVMQQETGFYGKNHEESGLLEDAQVSVYNDGTAEHVSETMLEGAADEA